MTVLWLRPDGAPANPPLAARLAEDHRVITLSESSTDARAVAALAPPVGRFVLIGQSSGAAAALELARATGDACTALVLIAPEFSSQPAANTVADVPMLLLLGMDDTRVPPGAAAALCTALPRAHPILVYGAGHALDRERVEAVSAVMRDFIARPGRDEFIVRAESDVIYP
jgi:pimeloyl-ACP methyl ester carboxylesterase